LLHFAIETKKKQINNFSQSSKSRSLAAHDISAKTYQQKTSASLTFAHNVDPSLPRKGYDEPVNGEETEGGQTAAPAHNVPGEMQLSFQLLLAPVADTGAREWPVENRRRKPVISAIFRRDPKRCDLNKESRSCCRSSVFALAVRFNTLEHSMKT